MTQNEQLSMLNTMHRKDGSAELNNLFCSACNQPWPCRTHFVLFGIPPELSPVIWSLRNLTRKIEIYLRDLRQDCKTKKIQPEHALLASIQLKKEHYAKRTLLHLELLISQFLKEDFSLTTSMWDQPDDAPSSVQPIDPDSTEKAAAIAALHQRQEGPLSKNVQCKDCGKTWPCDSYALATGLTEGSGQALHSLHQYAEKISWSIKRADHIQKNFPSAKIDHHMETVFEYLTGEDPVAVHLLKYFLTPPSPES